MARAFDGANDWIAASAFPTVAAATESWSTFGWVKPGATGVQHGLWASNVNNAFLLDILADNTPRFAKAGVFQVTSATTVSSGTWYNIGVIQSGSGAGNSIKIYRNGVDDTSVGGTATTLTTASPFFGAYAASTNLFTGTLAEVAWWNVELTTGELRALANGYSPLLVRPSALVFYYPLRGRSSPEPDIIGGGSGTLTVTTNADHPRIIMPRRKQQRYKATAAAGRIFKLAGYGGGLVGPQRGLAA